MAHVDTDVLQDFRNCVEEFKHAAQQHYVGRRISDDMLGEKEERLVEVGQSVLWRETLPGSGRFTLNKGMATELRKGGLVIEGGWFGPTIQFANPADPDQIIKVEVRRPDPDAEH